MRTQMDLRARRACAAAVVAGFAYAAPATLPASAQSTPAAAPSQAPVSGSPTVALPAHLVGPAAVDYRGRAIVAGTLGAAGAGEPLVLRFQASGSTAWQSLSTTHAGRGGRYRIAAALGRSGLLQVSVVPTAGAAVSLGSGPIPGSAGLGAAVVLTSLPINVVVRAGVGVSASRTNVYGAGRASVAGTVYPAQGGVAVALQVRGGGHWRTVARGRTGARGRYRLAFSPQGSSSELARVAVGADGPDLPGTRPIGRVNVYRLAEASWYGPGGTTACGQQLTSSTLGVANKTLPCGTLITLHYGSRTVRVPVIDRGPYVAGREFDLTAATKQALGFGDLGAVWTTAA